MSKHRSVYCLELGARGNELDCTVYYGFTPSDPGVRYYPDGSGCPPTSPEIEILEVKVESVDLWMWEDDDGVPCLGYPCLDRDWLEDRGWAAMVDEIAFRVLDDMAFDCESDFYRKLVDEVECGLYD